MSAAAVNILPLQLQHNRIRVHVARARYRAWREQVERFMVSQGMRAELEHVSDDQWEQHFAANADAYTAVVDELNQVD